MSNEGFAAGHEHMEALGGMELGFHALAGGIGSWEEATKQTLCHLLSP